ncbi:MAG: CocE/NonD family hydrolase [Gemmatimonadetes bacterium]|nr:CocE/NonD family hydrolase [Gemmatimonadota bacterium]
MGARTGTTVASGRVAFRTAIALALLTISAGSLGCDHDTTVLETHPLDVTGATNATLRSFYLTMSDGVRIAVDVSVPTNHPSGVLLPTILEMTRYWRRRSAEPSYHILRALQRGFVWIAIDERGTGASFGEWQEPLSDRALQDGREIIDWILAQPWSNGRVGATGVSYPGMAAQQLAAYGHPALKAIVPMSDTYDQYEDLIFPGGVFNEAFMQGWGDVVFAMDRNESISVNGESFRQVPVDADPSGELLAEAIGEHAGNLDAFMDVQAIEFRDDLSISGFSLDHFSTHSVAGELDESGVAVYQWGSWLDGGSADGVIRAFMESTGPRRATLGAWTHDLSSNSSLRDGGRWNSIPSDDLQWEEALNFFDDVLRKDKPLQERILRYFTMGEGVWKATSTWPIPGTDIETWYLGVDGSLTTSAPTAAQGEDLYEVNLNSESSADPRWLGPLFADTWYSDRAARDLALLVYESEPLSDDLEVTGYPVVNLNLSSTHSDGAFFVYLEDVSPQGSVAYVTEGILRGIHRKVTEEPSAWKRPIPYHSFLAADAEPMVPGEVTELAIGMEPMSFLFRAGHRIRIAIAGHDASAFRQVPETGTPILRVQRSSIYPSSIELPVIR